MEISPHSSPPPPRSAPLPSPSPVPGHRLQGADPRRHPQTQLRSPHLRARARPAAAPPRSQGAGGGAAAPATSTSARYRQTAETLRRRQGRPPRGQGGRAEPRAEPSFSAVPGLHHLCPAAPRSRARLRLQHRYHPALLDYERHPFFLSSSPPPLFFFPPFPLW